MSGRRLVVSKTAIVMIGLLAQGLARFFYTVVIGRLAGPEVLGQVNTVLSLAVYLSLFWPAALGVAGSRFIPSARRGGDRAADTIHTLTRSFWLSLPVVAGAGVAIAWIITADTGVAVAAGILVATYSGYVFVRGVMLGRDQVVRVGVVDVVSSVAALGLLLAVIATGSTPLLLLPLSAGYLAFSIIGWPRVPRATGPRSARDPEIRSFTAHTIVWLVAT
ncbi:MAG TPA: lipopolysaccharide biosynthesis protein, partial [Microcella sp.]|nr:lipopolysaccharide biosynthesis protein [Microcella sp.]